MDGADRPSTVRLARARRLLRRGRSEAAVGARTTRSSWSAPELAGQAVPNLAHHGARVTMLVRRRPGKAMSAYLVERIERLPAIDVRLRTEVQAWSTRRGRPSARSRSPVRRERSSCPRPLPLPRRRPADRLGRRRRCPHGPGRVHPHGPRPPGSRPSPGGLAARPRPVPPGDEHPWPLRRRRCPARLDEACRGRRRGGRDGGRARPPPPGRANPHVVETRLPVRVVRLTNPPSVRVYRLGRGARKGEMRGDAAVPSCAVGTRTAENRKGVRE